jgi:tetratricopeptide (TPR) repeat protein
MEIWLTLCNLSLHSNEKIYYIQQLDILIPTICHALEGIRHYSLHPLVREFCYKQFFFDQTGRGQALQLHSKVAQYFIQERSSLISILNEEKIHYHLIRAQEWGQIYTDIEVLGEDMIAQGHFDHLDKMINQLESSYQQIPPIATAFKGSILYSKGNIDEAAKLFLQIENSADLKTRINGILGFGEILHSRGNIQEADERFKLALDLLEDKKELFISEYIITLFNIGNSELAKSNYHKCFKLYKKTKHLAKKNNLQSEFATALNNIGLVHYEKKEYVQAMRFYSKSLYIREKLGEQANIAISLNNIGGIHAKTGDYNKAMVFYNESLQISKDLGNQFQISVSLNNTGELYRKKGNNDKARTFHLESLEICKNLNLQSNIGTSLSNLGSIFFHKQEFSTAIKYYQESILIRKKLGEQANIAISLGCIGYIYFKQSKFTEAVFYLLNSLLIMKSLTIPYKSILQTLLSLKQKLGSDTYKKAIETNLKKYEPKLQALFKDEVKQEVLGLPYRKKTMPDRNDTIQVKYSDGSIKPMKYKKALILQKKGEDIEILDD